MSLRASTRLTLAAVACLSLLTAPACGDDDTQPTADTHAGDTAAPADTAAADTTPPTDTAPDPDTTPTPAPTFQVWATDQGLHRVHVWEPAADGGYTHVGAVDFTTLDASSFDGAEPRTPHMVDFSPDGAYAFVAHTSSGHTSVIRASDLEVVAVLATGPGTHMVRVSPTGNVYVDVIGNADFPGRVLELSVDYTAETFSVSRTLIISDDPAFDADVHPSSSPVCGTSNDDDSLQFVTFGPGFGGAMLARIDNATFTIDHIYDPTAVRANCGAIVGPDGRLYFTGGAAATLDAAGVGVWYVLDPTTYAPIPFGDDDSIERSTLGTDAHGLAFTVDGSELWFANRDSDNLVVLDGATYAVKANVEDLFDGPDLIIASPAGDHLFVTLRGPNPRSGPHSIAGTTPGLAVVDVATRAVVTVLTGPDDDASESDYHGLQVRHLTPPAR